MKKKIVQCLYVTAVLTIAVSFVLIITAPLFKTYTLMEWAIPVFFGTVILYIMVDDIRQDMRRHHRSR